MKTFMLFTAVFGLSLWMSPSRGHTPKTGNKEDTSTGVIVAEDNTTLIITANHSNEHMLNIEVSKNGLNVLILPGCGKQTCSNDISSLPPGTYWVIVTTNMGTFSGQIIKS
ncbi:MAG: hypothetical protein KI786_19680 [Mameliella sp.]|nr:hypothetical protein [Phaeodactylibacter sp.]